jgi:hypothetical protein
VDKILDDEATSEDGQQVKKKDAKKNVKKVLF